MRAKNSKSVSGGNLSRASIRVGERIQMANGNKRTTRYPDGCIGADLAKGNYVRYLVERYHHYREADGSFGRTRPFHYAVLFKNVQAKFKAPTYFIPEGRFGELVDYLRGRIDNTILGRVNRTRGIPNYESFDEYVMQHMVA
jgi:hypothetical protein